MTLDQKIDALRPGESVRIGGTDELWTTAERSTDGRVVRFVRHDESSWTVFGHAAEAGR